jgi:hypothetical protein
MEAIFSIYRHDLDRCEFLAATLAGAAAVSFGASPIAAQSRAETLILVQELGPNSLRHARVSARTSR